MIQKYEDHVVEVAQNGYKQALFDLREELNILRADNYIVPEMIFEKIEMLLEKINIKK